MTSSERASLNASRPTSLSSQMAAITAAQEREDGALSSPIGSVKGKLDQIKQEDGTLMDIKQEDGVKTTNGMHEGGKNIKSEIKQEIKAEGMEEMDIKEEVSIKEEPGTSENGPETATPVASLDVVPTNTQQRRCIFRPDELRQKLMPTLEKLYRQDPESIPFRQPVDPQALGIPDYFDIVKKPMDLSTIKKKLDIGKYTDPWEYVDDVWLMFDNAWLYNKKTSRVYKYCTKVSVQQQYLGRCIKVFVVTAL